MANNERKLATTRLDIFDGLKGLSILTIIGYYFFEHILPGGFLAVNFFLFIAGFFNFRSFYTANAQGRTIKVFAYYKQRLERLFFPMLFMISLTVTFILFFARQYFFNLRNMALSSLLFLNNYFQIWNNQSYFVQAANPSPFTHLWYVGIYGQLVLLVPLLVLLTYKWHKKPAIAANILLIISVISAVLLGYLYQPGQDPTRIYYDVLTRAFAFTFGGAMGMLYPVNLKPKPMSKRMKLIFNLVGLLAVAFSFFMILFMYGTQPFAYRFGMTLYTLLSAVVVITAIHPATIWHKIFSLKPLIYLGKRSYSYYLWFYPVYLIMPNYLRVFNANIYFSFILQFLMIALLSELTYRLFEQPVWSMPFGQEFNWKKTKHQLEYLRNNPQTLTSIKVASGFYLFIVIMGLVGIIAAPEQRSEKAQDLQTLIESNQKIAEETQQTETQTVKIVHNIEGLSQQELLYANGLDITFIGDSILLASTTQIQQVFPKAVFEGQVGRQLYNSYGVVNQLELGGSLKPTVITMLGSNGTFTTAQLNDYIEAVGTDKDHFFVTVHVDRSWADDANKQIFAAAQRYGNVKVIEWNSYSNDHSEWFAELDGIHPNEEGSLELAKFIAQEIYRQR